MSFARPWLKDKKFNTTKTMNT